MSSTEQQQHTHTAGAYNPHHSHIKQSALQDWLNQSNLSDMTVIPGLGEATKNAIVKATTEKGCVCDTGYSLIGRYLAMKTSTMTTVEHANAFYNFLLVDCGVHGPHIHEVCKAVFERVNLIFHGLYDEADWPQSTRKLEVTSQSSQPEKTVKQRKH